MDTQAFAIFHKLYGSKQHEHPQCFDLKRGQFYEIIEVLNEKFAVGNNIYKTDLLLSAIF